MDSERIASGDLPADVLANILTRLPPNTRRRLRLVCRHWRDVVGTRTATNLLSRAKTLVAATGSAAYIVDNLSSPGNPRALWPDAVTEYIYEAMSVVGTCNGLVCLCDDRVIGGAVTLANPVTDEALSLPPLPPPRAEDQSTCYDRSWHAAYSFAYLPASALYKVVHVPCHPDRSVYEAVHVITLGEASWRDVPAGPAARCSLGDNVVSVDGVTYWATPETGKVMSFYLERKSIAPIMSLPSALSNSTKGGGWHLAEVRGRLAIVFSHTSWATDMDTTEVWVMEGATGQIRWSRWYIVQMTTPRHRPGTPSSNWFQRLTWPLFLHGERILTWETEWPIQRGCVLRMHVPICDTTRAKNGVVDISESNRGTVVTTTTNMSNDRRTFAYVETEEPLSVYKSAAV